MLAHASHRTPDSRRLRVGIIGGVDRTAGNLERAAAAFGCDLELHTGHTAGRGATTLAALIARVDLVVILTDVNSHNAVVAARKLAAAHGRRAVLLRRCGPSRLAALISGALGEQPSYMADRRPH